MEDLKMVSNNFLYFLITISTLSFLIFGIDKHKSIHSKRRISENTLLLLAFFGGTIGSVLGMLIFRHKISKTSFLVKFFLVVMLQVVVLYYFISNNGNFATK